MTASHSTDGSDSPHTDLPTAAVAHLGADLVETRWRLLARPTARAAVAALRAERGGAAETHDLAERVTDAAGVRPRHLAMTLHHELLPKLSDAGVLEYDSRSATARYEPDAHVEAILGRFEA